MEESVPELKSRALSVNHGGYRSRKADVQTNDMEITGKYLLNSAEKILSGRKETKSPSQREDASELTDVIRSTGHVRLAAMQANLNDVQRSYSREQARLNLLKDHPDEVSQELRFNDEPLFPELRGEWSRDDLIRTVEQSVNETKAQLKSMQVEMENHLALHFSAAPSAALSGSDLSAGIAGSRLDPERVARLTRSQS